MITHLLDIDTGMIDWSRAQFALTAIYHWLFVPLTLGLALIMGIMETMYVRTGEEFWKKTAQFWQKLFGINFAMGIATGIILEFEFGTNWSNYSWLVGDVFGAPLAIEGIVAFFMESTFVAMMFFGWKKVSKGFHLTATWLTGLGATISAWWILVANSWMQYPVGQEFNPDTVRNEMVSFADVALSPVAVDKFFHTVISAWVLGAIFVVGVSAWYLIKKVHIKFAKSSLKIGAIVGLSASVLAAISGDHSAYTVGQTQPMKLAAMEALYNGGKDQSLTIFAAVNPFKQPDYANEEEPGMKIAIPNMLSYLATHDFHGFVPGINDIINGYTKEDGTVELPLEVKIQRGKAAITALQDYRLAKKHGDEEVMAQEAEIIKDNIKYFGYGYISSPDQIVPYVPVCFYAFRIMVGGGCLFILLFALLLFYLRKNKDILKPRWLLYSAFWCIPLSYIVSECGWLVAEFGRQPWTIQDMLPTWAGVSELPSGSVITTFFIFLALFTTLLCVEFSIMRKEIKKGPQL